MHPFPPFDPDPATPRVRRFRPVPVRVLIPNVITLLAICLGLTAIRMAFENRIELAVYAIIAAGVLDGVDGRLARALKGTSRFGAQLDSLADFVNFGVAPAILLYAWTLDSLGSLGWLAAIVFALSAALRLARFNAALDGPEVPAYAQDFFVGVPAPAGATIVLLPIYLANLGIPALPLGAQVAALYCVACALLMVSRWPTWSGKKSLQRVPRDWVAPIFVGVIVAVGLVASYPWHTLALVSLVYLISLPLSAAAYSRLRRRHRAVETDGTAPTTVA